MVRVVIIARGSQWGLGQDAKLVEQALREAHAKKIIKIDSIDHLDPTAMMEMRPVDLQIHLEIPCRLAWPWAKRNWVLVNPEWWVRDAWDWAAEAADLLLFRSVAGSNLFADRVPAERRVVLPWRTPGRISTAEVPNILKKDRRFLYVVGGSVNKATAARTVVSTWRAEWPPLEVWGAADIIDGLRGLAAADAPVVWNTAFKSVREKEEAQARAQFHCVASAGEAFGYTMAEAASVGALPLWCGLPVHRELWGEVLEAVGRIDVAGDRAEDATKYLDQPFEVSSAAVVSAVESLLALSEPQLVQLSKNFQASYNQSVAAFRSAWATLLTRLAKQLPRAKQPFIPAKMTAESLSHVAVITLTHNRPKWFLNMSRNILLSDYPTSKLLWVIVDDGDGMGRVDEEVMRLREKVPSLRIEYVSLAKKVAVGHKRNLGVQAALSAVPETEVLLMMDDDDHYPKSSISARVSYLKQLDVGCVYCSTIPMYDCTRYISAMNVPPLDLGPAERVSEATLAFTRAFWEERKFPRDISIAEGEAFIRGREKDAVEISPAGVIVSFLHGANSTSRRVPAAQEPNGCHYGFDDDYFLYLTERGEENRASK
jgi:hypothetical protein